MRILMIESNTTGIAALKKLYAEGIEVLFLTADASYYRNCPDFAALQAESCRLIESPLVSSVDGCVGLVLELSKSHRIDGVTTFSELHIVHVAAVAAALQLPGMTTDGARNARHKHRTRLKLQGVANVSQPRFVHVEDAQALAAAVTTVGFPCVVKPSDGTGSLAVLHLNSAAELAVFLEELDEHPDYGRGVQRQLDLLVEEFIPGELVSVEACVQAGRVVNMGITDRVLSGFPHFIEMGCCYFREHAQQATLFAMNEAVLKGLGIDFGFIHTEYFLTPAGPVLCEVNGRLVGGVVPMLMQVSTGVDPQVEVVRQALGLTPRMSVVQDAVAAGRWFGVGSAGKLRSVEFNGVEARAGYVDSEVYRSVGSKIGPLAKSNFDWLGHVIFTGGNPTEAYARANQALDATVVTMDLEVVR